MSKYKKPRHGKLCVLILRHEQINVQGRFAQYNQVKQENPCTPDGGARINMNSVKCVSTGG